MAGFYGVWHGPNGLKNIAMKVNQYASKFANLALEAGFDIRHDDFFDTVVVETKDKTDEYVKRALNDVSVIKPKIISTMDGGIIVPKEPDAQIVPIARF